MKLLTIGNPKTLKGEAAGYRTAIFHGAPHKLSGAKSLCAYASPACAAACLNTAGQGGIVKPSQTIEQNHVQMARMARSKFFLEDREGFMSQLAKEIGNHVKTAKRNGLIPVVRLNGTTDIPWERIPVTYLGKRYSNMFAAFPNVTFYDYTKFPLKFRKVKGISNYSLTFSMDERPESETRALEALENGANVAVVFRIWTKNLYRQTNPTPLPTEFMGKRVVDGDKNDLRFLDPKGVIVGLRSKGKAFYDETGFVKDVV